MPDQAHRPNLSHRRRAEIIGIVLGVVMVGDTAVAKEPLVLVERVVDTRYGENDTANLDFDLALQSPLVTTKKVVKGDTLQSIVSDVYGLTPRAGYHQYTAIEERVKELNGISNVDKLGTNSTLVLPDIPAKQQTVEAYFSPTNIKPRVSNGPSFSDVLSGQSYSTVANATKWSSLTNAFQKRASPLESQWRWIPASLARSDKSVSVIAQPLTINFADNPPVGSDYSAEIDSDIRLVQKYASSNAATHQSLVVVLDDSWPDEKAFEESLTFITQSLVKVYSDYHLGQPTFSNQVAASRGTMNTTFPFDSDGRGSHARAIESALAPFEKISTNVKVVYLPLFVEQKWSQEIIRELIRTRMIAKGKDQYRNDALSPDSLSRITALADQKTDEIMSQLPKRTNGQPAATDEAIISAVLYFCQLYSEDTSAPFFLSASWTVAQYEVEFGPDPNLLGAVFAASGNSESDVYQTDVLLASRAKESPGDVIVVGNAHPNGDRSGCSSYWSPPSGVNVYGLFYDGFLTKQECGSSFSTPRVAWVMALRESTLPLVSADMARKQWYIDFRKLVLGLQNQAASGPLHYWFSPSVALQRR